MFGFGMPELIIVLVIALVVGPSKLPQLGQALGSSIKGFKKGMNEDDVKVIDKTNEA